MRLGNEMGVNEVSDWREEWIKRKEVDKNINEDGVKRTQYELTVLMFGIGLKNV